MIKHTMLKNPSPRMKPCVCLLVKSPQLKRKKKKTQKLTEAKTINGVPPHPFLSLHHQLNTPPNVLASVKDGTLYMPTATAIPPGISACQRLLEAAVCVRTAVVTAKSTAAPRAHSLAMGGRPWPVTRRAVKIQT